MKNVRKMAISRYMLISMLMLVVGLAACNVQTQTSGEVAQVPAGLAYADGKEIYFTHTEASDAGIAQKLTDMMQSPVLYVPSLADVPLSSLAQVYVFENGVTGKGPLGFQPDVFNHPVGTEGYTPLRQIILVKWRDGVSSTLLKSEEEILLAESSDQVMLTNTTIVVNMPFLVWDGGKR